MKPLQVLLVEDDDAYARLLRERLREQTEIELVAHAGTLAEAIAVAGRTRVDVAMLDLGLPDSEGVDTVAAFHAAHGRIPIIVLSGLDSISATLEAMRHGAQEYLVKGQGEAQLLPRVVHAAIERKRLQELEQLLVGVVSHDLRGPLQTIVLACEVAVMAAPQVADKLGRALKAARRAEGLVNDLLDLTRSRVGGLLPVDLHDVDLVPLVEGIVQEHAALSRRDIRLAAPASAVVSADAQRIGQVVANLVGNAVQHSPSDQPVHVTIGLEEGSLTIAVANGGAPIPEALVSRLFEPLERAQLSSENHSIGLGLYIVNEIVKAHGGSIDVASTAETGTTFTVRLPR